MKKPLIILTGPTAVGKTAISIALAKAVDGEIISADSMQVYRHMNIGSAKITTAEMAGVKHHLLDIFEPCEEFSVVHFQTLAKAAIAEIYQRQKTPIIVGGTGFYIQALLYDIDFSPSQQDKSYRQELEAILTKKGNDYLYQLLVASDPQSAATIHKNNSKKVIRALEFFYETGQSIALHNGMQRQKDSPYNFAYFVLNNDRKLLYEQIDARVEQMIAAGLVTEVKNLLVQGVGRDLVSMQGLGYKEIAAYLDGEMTLEEAVYILKRDTRHFAKRQLTWFRREREVLWLDKQNYTDEQQLLNEMLDILRNKEIVSTSNSIKAGLS